jgi:TonB family protein
LPAKRIIRFLLPSFFWLSILLHLLIFLAYYFFVTFHPQEKPEKDQSYYDYVPAYTQTMPSPTSMQQPKSTQKLTAQKQAAEILAKTNPAFDLSHYSPSQRYQSVLQKLNNLESINQMTTQTTEQRYKSMKPIHMIGEKLLDDPLYRLLGQAITAQLYYPSLAKELHLHGIVRVGFMLYPDGGITGMHVMKTSRERILDIAALRAINKSFPVHDVGMYLKEPKFMVINIVF